MPNRISEIAETLRQIGDIKVTDWDLRALANKELEIGESLRKLGNLKVNDWDIEQVAPSVHRLAHTELELGKLVKRAANYKVLDWPAPTHEGEIEDDGEDLPIIEEEADSLKARLQAYLEFMVASLVNHPEQADVRIEVVGPEVFRFHVRTAQADVKSMIGREGEIAGAIRRLLKASARSRGVHALLDIRSHEEAGSSPA